MTDKTHEQPIPRADVVAALRALAIGGAAVPEMVAEIQTRLGHEEIITVLWYFIKAFALRLPDVLEIRAWLCGARTAEEINSLILPLIEQSRGKWYTSSNGAEDNVGERPAEEFAHDLQ
jgi:hypothetical protein